MTEQEQQHSEMVERELTEATIAETIGSVATRLIEAIKQNAEKGARTLLAVLMLVSPGAVISNAEATKTAPPQPQDEVMVYEGGEVPADRAEDFNAVVSSLIAAEDEPEVK